MGAFVAKLKTLFDFKTEKRILMLGLDAAGKTTILYGLKLGEVVHTVPTIGFNVDTVTYKSVEMNVWDVGGQTKIRPLWRYYYQGSHALIYVVDSNDTERIAEASEELFTILQDDSLRGIPVLVLANKQDMPRAEKPSALADKLGLTKLRGHEWYIQGCCGVTRDGLYEGLDWVVDQLKSAKQ